MSTPPGTLAETSSVAASRQEGRNPTPRSPAGTQVRISNSVESAPAGWPTCAVAAPVTGPASVCICTLALSAIAPGSTMSPASLKYRTTRPPTTGERAMPAGGEQRVVAFGYRGHARLRRHRGADLGRRAGRRGRSAALDTDAVVVAGSRGVDPTAAGKRLCIARDDRAVHRDAVRHRGCPSIDGDAEPHEAGGKTAKRKHGNEFRQTSGGGSFSAANIRCTAGRSSMRPRYGPRWGRLRAGRAMLRVQRHTMNAKGSTTL